MSRFNELEQRWAAYETWTFTREFEVSSELLAHTRVDLVLEGVDTVADVLLNEQVLASLSNAFRFPPLLHQRSRTCMTPIRMSEAAALPKEARVEVCL